jgi:ABC-type uncharacterized transport system YnjBCD ATPase subunit
MPESRNDKRAAVARAGRALKADPDNDLARRRFRAAQAEYREATLAEIIAAQIAKEPPLSAGQRARLALILTASPRAPFPDRIAA